MTDMKKSNFKEPEPQPFLHENHKKPKTRRDFLAHGFIGMSSSLILPSFTSLLAKSAYAETAPAVCEIPQFEGGLPYICIDVAGGMNIAGSNVIVGMTNGGEFQEDVGSGAGDYIRLGIAPSQHPTNGAGEMVDTYGLKFHSASGVLQGMNSILEGETMDGTNPVSDGVDGLVFCTRTSDDTSTNQINTVYMANKAGAKGELVNLIGNNSSDSGGRSLAPADQVNLTIKPTQIQRFSQASGLLSLGDALSSDAYLNLDEGQDRVQTFLSRIANMSKTKLDALAQQQSLGQIQNVLNCSFDNAQQLFQMFSASELNPANDEYVVNEDQTGVFNGASENMASVAKLVIDKVAGAGTITIGGGDYHGNQVMNTHNKDVEVGKAIGRCILLAARKQENLAIHLYTDGGVSGDSGGASQVITANGRRVEKVMWTGDSGTRSAALLLFYKHGHDGSSLVKDSGGNPRRQVGNFVQGGGVNLDTVIGDSTVNLWKAIMLNYLAAQDREGDFETIFGAGSLPPDHEQLIRMKPIV